MLILCPIPETTLSAVAIASVELIHCFPGGISMAPKGHYRIPGRKLHLLIIKSMKSSIFREDISVLQGGGMCVPPLPLLSHPLNSTLATADYVRSCRLI